MQWRDATVGGMETTGFGASGSDAARRERDVRQVFDQIGYIGQASQARQVAGSAAGQVGRTDQPVMAGSAAGQVGRTDQPVMAGSGAALSVGFDLPCTQDPELFFAESPQDVERAKAMCRACRARIACLAGALERREPWGVWGGELLLRGAIVSRKRPRGRPRKSNVAA